MHIKKKTLIVSICFFLALGAICIIIPFPWDECFFPAYDFIHNEALINKLETAVRMYEKEYSALPDSNQTLKKDHRGIKWVDDISDSWGNDFILLVGKHKITIICYGKDGKRGGVDLNEDWIYELTLNKGSITKKVVSRPKF